MRKAAVEAGIIEDLQSNGLLLCLEPEGASIQCREDSEESIMSTINPLEKLRSYRLNPKGIITQNLQKKPGNICLRQQ